MELTYDEIMELKYEARHGDEWAQMKIDEYYDQFEEIPSPMTFDEAIAYKQAQIYEDTIYWLNWFSEYNDYYGDDGRYYYPQYDFWNQRGETLYFFVTKTPEYKN